MKRTIARFKTKPTGEIREVECTVLTHDEVCFYVEHDIAYCPVCLDASDGSWLVEVDKDEEGYELRRCANCAILFKHRKPEQGGA